MQIVVLDGRSIDPGDLDWSSIKACGILSNYDRTPAELTARRLIGADVVLTRGVHIGADELQKAKNCKLIINLAGEDGLVDEAAAKKRGIRVADTGSGIASAVAQHTMALLLEIANGTAHYDLQVHRGRWTASPDFCYMDQEILSLNGLTLGLVGTGAAAKQVGRAAEALGMRILYAGTAEKDFPGEQADLEELLSSSDVISLHCAATAETDRLIGADAIALMKDGVVLINTASGSLVEETAIMDALGTGHLRAYGTDVSRVEPITRTSPLMRAENCLITPHIAWAPKRLRQQMIDSAAELIKSL